MINFPKLFGQGAIGGLLRKLLAILPDTMVLPVIQGKLKGKKWIKGAGVNGYWLGTYEIEHQNKISELVKPGHVFWDIGAHVGYFTLLAADLVGHNGKVYAFEPFSRNVSFLKKHIALNSFKVIEILQLAVAGEVGQAAFEESDRSSMGKISSQGSLVVNTTTVDDLVFNKKLNPPSIIKIDVEGLQDEVLLGALKTLEVYQPSILIEAEYKPNDKRNFYNTLSGLGYVVKPLSGNNMNSAGDFYAIHGSKVH